MSFRVLKGVKLGGIVSPIMFCVYYDKLLLSLADSGVGVILVRFLVSALAYAEGHTKKCTQCDQCDRLLLTAARTVWDSGAQCVQAGGVL